MMLRNVLHTIGALLGGYGEKEIARVELEAEPFGKRVEFPGFDANNESTLLNIHRFLVEKMDRFSRFKGRVLNSHMPTATTYRRILNVFDPIGKTLTGRDLSVDELISILKAMKYQG